MSGDLSCFAEILVGRTKYTGCVDGSWVFEVGDDWRGECGWLCHCYGDEHEFWAPC